MSAILGYATQFLYGSPAKSAADANISLPGATKPTLTDIALKQDSTTPPPSLENKDIQQLKINDDQQNHQEKDDLDGLLDGDAGLKETAQETHKTSQGYFSKGLSAFANLGISVAKGTLTTAKSIAAAVAPETYAMVQEHGFKYAAITNAVDMLTNVNNFENDLPALYDNIRQKTGSEHFNMLFEAATPQIVKAIIDKAGDGVLKKYLENNKDKLHKLVELSLFKPFSDFLDKAHSEWEKGDKKQSFRDYVINFIFKEHKEKLTDFDKVIPKIMEIKDSGLRQLRLKQVFGDQLASSLLKMFLPNGLSSLPLSSVAGSILDTLFYEVIEDYLAEYIVSAQDAISQPHHTPEDMILILSRPNGQKLVEFVHNSVKALTTTVPQLISSKGSSIAAAKASEFIADMVAKSSPDTVDENDKKGLAKSYKNWLEKNINGIVNANIEESAFIKGHIENTLSSFIFHLAASILKEKPESAADDVFDILVNYFKEFFVAEKENLLQLEDKIKALPTEFKDDKHKAEIEKQKNELIRNTYSKLATKLLKATGLDEYAIAEKLGIVGDIVPAYLHRIFIVLESSKAQKDELIGEILSKVSEYAPETAKGQADKAFLADSAGTIGNFILGKVREKIHDSADLIISKVEGALSKKLNSEEKVKMTESIQLVAKKDSGVPQLFWDEIQNLIESALLKGTDNTLASAGAEKSKAIGISGAVVHLANQLKQFGPEIEDKRRTELKAYKENIKLIEAKGLSDEEKEIELKAAHEAHTQKLQEIYRPYVKNFMQTVTYSEKGESLKSFLAELNDIVEPIWNTVWDEIVPGILASMHEKTMQWSDERDDLRIKVRDSFKSDVPVLLARVGAGYAQAFIPHFLKKELAKVPAGGDEGKTKEALLAEKVIDGLSSFFESKGAKPAGSDLTTGKSASDYLKEHKAELAAQLANNMLEAGNYDSVAKGLPILGDYIEGILLQVSLGMFDYMKAGEKNNPAYLISVISSAIREARQKLQALNEPNKVIKSEIKTAANKNKLVDRILNKVGITKDSLAVPEEVRDTVWDALNDSILPNALGTIATSVVNPMILRKIILASLESYKGKAEASAQKAKEDELAYEAAKKEVMSRGLKAGEKFPERPKPVAAPKVEEVLSPAEQAAKQELTDEIGYLLEQVGLSTGDRLIAKALKNKKVKEMVSSTIAEILYQQFTKESVLGHVTTGMSAAISNLSLAKEVDGVKVNRKVEIRDVSEEVNGKTVVRQAIFDKDTNEEVKDFDFNITDVPQEVVQQIDKETEVNIHKLLGDISSMEVKNAIKNPIKKMWLRFQDAWDKASLKLGVVGGKTKLFLDRLCVISFTYTIGRLVGLMGKGLDKGFRLVVDKKAKNVLKKLYNTFDKDLAANAGASILDQMDKNGMPKIINELNDGIRIKKNKTEEPEGLPEDRPVDINVEEQKADPALEEQ